MIEIHPAHPAIAWPRKHDVLGIGISATTYDESITAIIAAAQRRQSAVVSLHAVHAVVTASRDPALRDKVNQFDLVAPDGQPVRWALNWLYNVGLAERVYGPELMLRLCSAAAQAGVPIYLYGGADEVTPRLVDALVAREPKLKISGYEAPPFRPLSAAEDAAMVERIEQSGAGLVFIGLGCPKQDHFAFDHRDRIRAVQVCVGAAFDFHAGVKRMAPPWMQERGLEWLFRLGQEPRRLAGRYLTTNTLFLAKLGVQAISRRRSTAPRNTAETPPV